MFAGKRHEGTPLLYRAALAADLQQAFRAMRKWLDRFDADAPSVPSHRLIARAFCRLASQLDGHPMTPRLNAVSRQLWLRAKANFQTHAELFRALNEAGPDWVLAGQGMWFLLRGSAPGEGADVLDVHISGANAGVVSALIQDHGWKQSRRKLSRLRFPGQAFFFNERTGARCRLVLHFGRSSIWQSGHCRPDEIRRIGDRTCGIPVPSTRAVLVLALRSWPLIGAPQPDLVLDLANCFEALGPEEEHSPELVSVFRSRRARTAMSFLQSAGFFRDMPQGNPGARHPVPSSPTRAPVN